MYEGSMVTKKVKYRDCCKRCNSPLSKYVKLIDFSKVKIEVGGVRVIQDPGKAVRDYYRGYYVNYRIIPERKAKKTK